MPSLDRSDRIQDGPGAYLTSIYVRVTFWYLLAVGMLWMLGFEGIYRHPFPFYAYPSPVFRSMVAPIVLLALVITTIGFWRAVRGVSWHPFMVAAAGALAVAGVLLALEAAPGDFGAALAAQAAALKWQLLATLVFGGSMAVLAWILPRLGWFDDGLTRRQTAWILVALVGFAFVFPASIAMLRGGVSGISQAYERTAYEYIGDIGSGGSIRGLFQNYETIQPYLSMHAKVHPPGPIVILWALSYVFGRGALELSLATMALGALSVVPMYFWAAELIHRRAALTCAVLYTLVPSIVIFTATSADVTFMPFTLTTLFLFHRALNRASIAYALAAGALYGVLSLISFSLVSVGVYFALIGLLRLRARETRRGVVQTAALMVVGLLALHAAVRFGTGFDVVEVFRMSAAQFNTDQLNLDRLDPRLPAWVWKFGNPASWFFFAGIPVSVLFIRRLVHPGSATRGLFYAFALALVAFDILYLARGEGERSAMYVMPFLVVPAGHYLDELGEASRSTAPLLATAVFLGLQSWGIECIFYTYW